MQVKELIMTQNHQLIAIDTIDCFYISAGCVAYLMGLPIRITCTTNVNDTVHRALTHGEYCPQKTTITIAPAMDIQVYLL